MIIILDGHEEDDDDDGNDVDNSENVKEMYVQVFVLIMTAIYEHWIKYLRNTFPNK